MANPQAIQRWLEYPQTPYWSFLLLRNWEIWICKAHRLWSAYASFSWSSFWKGSPCAPWLSKCCVLNLQSKQKRGEGDVFTCFYSKNWICLLQACVFRQITGFSQWFITELSTRIHCSWLSRGEVRKIPMPSHPELPSVIHKFCNSISFSVFFLIQKIKSKCTIMFISCISIIVFVLEIFF